MIYDHVSINRSVGVHDPVLSYLHQLFNVDQCQAYIHTLTVERSAPPVSPMPEPGH